MTNYGISEQDKKLLFATAERITATHQQGRYRKDILLTNVLRLMQDAGENDIRRYLNRAE